MFTDNDEDELFFQRKVKIDQEEMNFTFVLDTILAKKGIEFRHLLIDWVFTDYIRDVKQELIHLTS